MRVLCGLLLVLAIGPWIARAAELTVKEITAARKLYVTKCAKCHRFYEPTNYAEVDWQTWMAKMNRKSKLQDDRAALLTRYLDAYRAGQLPAKPERAP